MNLLQVVRIFLEISAILLSTCWCGSPSGQFEVHIVTWGLMNPAVNLGAVPFIRPALDTAVAKMQRQFNTTINISLTYVYDDRHRTCQDVADNIDNSMAKWWYRQSGNADVFAFIGPGISKQLLMY